MFTIQNLKRLFRSAPSYFQSILASDNVVGTPKSLTKKERMYRKRRNAIASMSRKINRHRG